MNFNQLKKMPVASLLGLTIMTASPVFASGGVDQPFCEFNGDKEWLNILVKSQL